MNKYASHVFVIPEDDCDRQLVNGFADHPRVLAPRIQVMPPPGGWSVVRQTFEMEYIPRLRQYLLGHVIMVIDFDGVYTERRTEFEKVIPDDLRQRVFVIGARQTPEKLKLELGKTYEQIGMSLAEDCHAGTELVWSHEHLKHNDPDRNRLIEIVKPFLLGIE